MNVRVRHVETEERALMGWLSSLVIVLMVGAIRPYHSVCTLFYTRACWILQWSFCTSVSLPLDPVTSLLIPFYSQYNNNNNNNNTTTIFMSSYDRSRATARAQFTRFTRWIQKWRQVAADFWTKPTGLSRRPAYIGSQKPYPMQKGHDYHSYIIILLCDIILSHQPTWRMPCSRRQIFLDDDVFLTSVIVSFDTYRRYHPLDYAPLVIEHSPFQRQERGTVCHQKWRHQQHCQHSNPNWKLICSPYHFVASCTVFFWLHIAKTMDLTDRDFLIRMLYKFSYW